MTKICCLFCSVAAFSAGCPFTGMLLIYIVFFKEFK